MTIATAIRSNTTHERLSAPTSSPKSNGSPRSTMSQMTVSPAMAANWLENANVNNRRLSDPYAGRLARDMKRGKWRLTHEGIAFDTSGVLLDGQHRLWAIVLSDTSIKMNVWRGVPRDALMAIDCGKSRNAADIMKLTKTHGSIGSSEIAVLRAMLGGLSGRKMSLTVSETATELSRHEGAIAFAMDVIPHCKRISTASTRAVIARAYYSADQGLLINFGRMLISGLVTNPNDIGMVLLRQYLIEHCSGANSEQITRYAKTERALVAFLKNEKISVLYGVNREFFPLPEEASRS